MLVGGKTYEKDFSPTVQSSRDRNLHVDRYFRFFFTDRPSKLFSLQKGHLNYGRGVRRYSVRVFIIRKVSRKKFSY